MLTVVVGVMVVLAAVAVIGLVAATPVLAGRLSPRPADQLAEMRRSEPASTGDDPGDVTRSGE